LTVCTISILSCVVDITLSVPDLTKNLAVAQIVPVVISMA